MISSVSAWRRGCSSTGSSRGQLATSRSATSAIRPDEPLHLLAVEGGQHELALLEVRALVEQDHRVGAHDRLEDLRALAGMQHLGRGGEDLLDLVGVGEHARTAALASRRIVKRLP